MKPMKTTKLTKKMKKDEAKALKLDVQIKRYQTIDLFIMAFARCCALFVKSAIVALAVKTVLF